MGSCASWITWGKGGEEVVWFSVCVCVCVCVCVKLMVS